MKTRHLIFNILAGVFVALTSLSLISILFMIPRESDENWRTVWYLLLSFELLFILLVGTGALFNLLKGRLLTAATVAIIAGYFITGWLIPFAVWGVVELVLQNKTEKRGA